MSVLGDDRDMPITSLGAGFVTPNLTPTAPPVEVRALLSRACGLRRRDRQGRRSHEPGLKSPDRHRQPLTAPEVGATSRDRHRAAAQREGSLRELVDPLAMRANIEHNHVRQDHVLTMSIDMSIDIMPVPRVPADERIVVDDLGYADDGI